MSQIVTRHEMVPDTFIFPERLKIRHMGTVSQNFEIGLRGVDLAGLTCAPVPAKNLTATLAKKDDETFTLTITIEKTTEDAGRGLAEWAAQVFFESIINQFANDVQEAAGPRAGSSRFDPAPEGSVVRVLTGEQIAIHLGRVAVPLRPSQAQLEAIKNRFEFGLTIQQFAPAAVLYKAKEMFFIGMQSKDKVVRFLILYSAVRLVVPYKNSSNEPGQTEVDNLLRQANPAVSYKATGKTKARKDKTGKIITASRPKYETLYTKLRNDFVHAEERGSDPTAAIKAIEQNIAAFQRDVAKVLT